jgi:hypothetical protein
MRAVRLAVGALVVSMLLFGLAACGGDGGSERPGVVASPQATAAPSSTEPVATAEPGPTEQPQGGETAAGVNPCDLVTKGEAEAALGASVGEPKVEDTPPVSACTYETANFETVQVVVTTFEDAGQARDAFQSAIDINGYEEISGIGDRAYNAQPIFDISVLKGKYDVSIDVALPDDQDEMAVAQDLARTAVDRLP